MAKEKERFEILLEDLQSQFRLAFEGITALNEKVQNLPTVEQLNEKFQILNYRIDGVYNNLHKQMETIAKLLDYKIDQVHQELKSDLKRVEDKVDGIDQKLDSHIRTPASLAHV